MAALRFPRRGCRTPVTPASTDPAQVLGGDAGHSAAENAIERDLAMAGGVRQGIEFEPGCKVGRKPWEPAGLNELTWDSWDSSRVAAIAPIVVAGVTGIGVELVRRAADEAVPVVLVGQSRLGLHSEIFLEE